MQLAYAVTVRCIKTLDYNTAADLHWPGIEPGPPAWQARILPLNHQCIVEGIA